MTVINTKELQIKSLLVFAGVLGYKPRDEKLSRGFVAIDLRTWHTHYISFSDMCRLHNGILVRVLFNSGVRVYDFLELTHIDISDDAYDRAIKLKLVHHIKLQPIKPTKFGIECCPDRSDGVLVQNHLVSITEHGKKFKELTKGLLPEHSEV
ncbi:hypothetical protein VPHG_00057 [Vibrio phage 11895-B1]|uniref:hypothetical protein n=1 Tax=Vibrio phage 11895-B1 TaxID=754075 RepID=UPI0002C0A78A|nr:hypothetical protein VPHG_00057 [Vibrio phage 11895-B1]AGH32124.1 hypothetical protein VPHG_00057 [Vibrio phage 11895-B1]